MLLGDNVREFGARILAPLVDFVFPPYCLLCESHLGKGESLVCAACWIRLPTLEDKVAAPGQASSVGPSEWFFASSLAVWPYCDELQKIIHMMKYERRPSLTGPLGTAIGGSIFVTPEYANADVLVPVPLHKTRLRERGYNQSLLLAQSAARITSMPVDEGLLRRVRYTKPQVKLGAKERAENVRGAFQLGSRREVVGKTVVVIDDVFTTGVTTNECARVLVEAGAKKVLVATAARA